MDSELTKIEQEFLSVSQAIDLAFQKIIDDNKKKGTENNSAYIWRQRFKQGKLSHKKASEILEEAGFKKVVEEKWIMINRQSKNNKAASVRVREERTFSQEKAPGRSGHGY